MQKVSVIIITQNEEKNIHDCLNSVKWADEIVVVDALSEDRTVDICREYTDKIFQNPWPGYAAQKQFALDHAVHPWVLSIDADERVTLALQQEIVHLMSGELVPFHGYKIPRLSYFLGKAMRYGGWYPGYQLRLFRKDKTRVNHVRVHEGFLVEGACGYLKSDFIHLTHRTVEESLERMNRYSSLEALDRFEQHRRERIRWVHFFLHPLAAFARQYIVKQGFRDGVHGLVLAVITAVVNFALYVKLWELQQASCD